MIKINNFKKVLQSLGFSQELVETRWIKIVNGAKLEVDFEVKSLTYPEDKGLTINERQTCNFSSNENFVVFECVHRLLEKGYKPEHIELEPKWKLGRGASGGRADILVKDNFGDPLLIIECKTAGTEFTRAWNKTLLDGDQLFSYAHQINKTQFLCLYQSDFTGDVTYTSNIIAHRDNEKYLSDNPSLVPFSKVNNVKERFAVWRDTYKLDFTTKGIFEDNIQPYQIGKDKYSLDDLKFINAEDQQKKYHEYATILRQHNVSGRENAFDKLINLFLCKLVDETENPDELKFYWKGVAYDTHFELLDRLQQLYQRGMKEFLGEEITYINQDDLSNAMRFYKQNPDATQKAVWNLFMQQKFFTNNDFSLIDVHNEKLFYQNAEIILKILQMWQDVRLIGDNRHNQFLGDMFEGFLDQGVKQSEGQFFTPMPICRFIMQSLPLQSILSSSPTPPKAIDYACGAGHFLNELALQIKDLIGEDDSEKLSDYHKAIYGIEKEYRLSKVAKVSAFMYGQKNIHICYGDALVKEHDAFPEIVDGTFDILVANPPYSVRGFLETLPENERKAYELNDTIDKIDSNNSIETFFIERAKQLLKAGGVAAIILPSSILNNGNGTYVKTRELLIHYFDIVAIAEFGSGTFGKTGTNTVTLFLRRKKTMPDCAEHYKGRVDEWFKQGTSADKAQDIYKDEHLLKKYVAHIEVSLEEYKTMLSGKPNNDLMAHDTFSQYRKDFDSLTEIKNLKKKKSFKELTKDEKEAELEKRFVSFVQNIERDKVYHFVMASSQNHPVVIIKSPSKTAEVKKFLGYEWSGRKGDEGIKLNKDANDNHDTLLYDETNRDNIDKINTLIANNFNKQRTEIPEHLTEFASSAKLVDMLDFSRTSFEKQVGLSPKQSFAIETKWESDRLGNLTEYVTDKLDITQLNIKDYITTDNLLKDRKGITQYEGESNLGRVTHYTENDILLSNIRPYLKKIWLANKEGGCSNDVLVFRNIVPNKITPEYLYNILSMDLFFDYVMSGKKGLKMPRGDKDQIVQFPVPIPPKNIQQKIVNECSKVDKLTEASRNQIEYSKNKIEEVVSQAIKNSSDSTTLKNLDVAILNPSKTEIRDVDDNLYVSFVEMSSVSEDGFITHPTDRPLGELRKGSYKYFAENDIIIAKITPCMENGKCALAKGLTNKIGMGSSEFHVIRTNTENYLPEYIFYLLNRDSIRKAAEKQMTGSSGHRRVPISFYEKLLIPVKTVAEQKQLITKIQKLEKIISDAQTIIDSAPEKKESIMKKYL